MTRAIITIDFGMKFDVKAAKPYVLPAAIILGLLFHGICEQLSALVPYLIFSILILTFASTELRRLKFEKLDLWLMLFQIVASVGLYLIFLPLFPDATVAEGMMMGALCPVASSVTVIAGILGAKKEDTVAYTIIGNLLVCVLAPVIFVFIGENNSTNLTDSFFAIFGRIATVIGLPFFIMLAMQLWMRPVVKKIAKYSGFSFYIWAVTLLLTLGQTIDFIFLHGQGHMYVIVTLGVGAFIICPAQFYFGRKIGKRYNTPIAGQQLLGQKNSAMGIWMANTYLNPLASTFLAFYSVAQNLINSLQIWRYERRKNKTRQS